MTKHVFLSFVAEDLAMVNLFRGQARNRNSSLSFDDYSVKVPYNSTQATYIRSEISKKIRAASVTICLIGSGTASSPWVSWELQRSAELGNKVFGVRLYSTAHHTVPSSLVSLNANVLTWDIEAIVREIG